VLDHLTQGYRVCECPVCFVPHLSAVSVMHMSTHNSAPAPTARGWQAFNMTAAVLALAALAALIILLVTKWAGGEPWTGFTWIAMLCLPAAFLMMGASVIHAVSLRRRL
jgi:hypothetical protein